MIRNGYEAADTFGSSYLVLDRYFLTVPALTELNQLNQSAHLLDVITRLNPPALLMKSQKLTEPLDVADHGKKGNQSNSILFSRTGF